MTHLQIASETVAYIAAIIPWTFVMMYQVITGGRWRRDPLGWHIMTLTAVDAGVFTMLLCAMWWPTLALHESYEWAYICMVAGIPAVTVWRGYLLWRIYHPRSES